MAWSDAARRAAALARKLRSQVKYDYDSNASVRKMVTKSFNQTYRDNLAREIRETRQGRAPLSRVTMLRAYASSVGKRRFR